MTVFYGNESTLERLKKLPAKKIDALNFPKPFWDRAQIKKYLHNIGLECNRIDEGSMFYRAALSEPTGVNQFMYELS